jgi:serine/threonine protein kinase
VFLERMHLVHRGLMARQFLVGKDASDVRLGGLARARDVYVTDVYMQRGAPDTSNAENVQEQSIRWLAPECLRDGEFTHASDVWAMGVVLYEIFSYARSPYGNLTPREVAKEVGSGLRLEQPPSCPDTLFALMRRMWASSARLRPTCADVLGELILHHVPEAHMLINDCNAARTQGHVRLWGVFSMAQVRPGPALGSESVLVEVDTDQGSRTLVGERVSDAARLAAEVRAWAAVWHDHVVLFTGVCYDAALLLHAFDPNSTVPSLLQNRVAISSTQRIKFILDAALGLEYLHGRGIVHQRLSARHLVVAPNGYAQLFGFSAANFKTMPNDFPWTCPWARATNEVSPASDIYSLAATLFEVFTYPALPPAETGLLQTGRPEFMAGVNRLLMDWAARSPESRPRIDACISSLESMVYGEDRWAVWRRFEDGFP